MKKILFLIWDWIVGWFKFGFMMFFDNKKCREKIDADSKAEYIFLRINMAAFWLVFTGGIAWLIYLLGKWIVAVLPTILVVLFLISEFVSWRKAKATTKAYNGWTWETLGSNIVIPALKGLPEHSNIQKTLLDIEAMRCNPIGQPEGFYYRIYWREFRADFKNESLQMSKAIKKQAEIFYQVPWTKVPFEVSLVDDMVQIIFRNY